MDAVASFLVENGNVPVPPSPTPLANLSAYDPPDRDKTITQQTVTKLVPGTKYVDCKTDGVSWNGISEITWIGTRLPTSQLQGVHNVWIGGRPDAYMTAGPRSDGHDLLQIKRWPRLGDPNEIPSNVTLRWINPHDVTRPNVTPPLHPDGYQIMAGHRIYIVEHHFQRVDIQPVFFRYSGSLDAGGGDITEALIESSIIEKPPNGYYTAIFYSDNNRVRNCLMRNLRLGSSARINPNAYTNGCRAENLMHLDGTPFVPGFVKA